MIRATRLALVCLVAILVSVVGASVAQAAPGDLDTTFDTDGKLTTDFGGSESAKEVAVQPDGRVIVGGSADNGFALARYNTDGSLDTTFHTDGRVTTDIGEPLRGLALLPDGKILAAGNTVIARYEADGDPDPLFGTDGIRALTTPGAIKAMALAPDGKIVFAGNAPSEATGGTTAFMVARYTSGGIPDNSFGGGDGVVTTEFPPDNFAVAEGVAVQPDGRILAAGYSQQGSDAELTLVRYTTDGSLDASFSGDGKQITTFGDQTQVTDVILQPDGKFVVVGATDAGPANLNDFALWRYTPGGELDTTFDGDGLQTIDFGATDDFPSDIALQQNGKLVVVGSSNNPTADNWDFSLARLTPGGGLDTGFAGDGKQTIDFLGYDFGEGIALAPDGKIVAVGSTDKVPDGINPSDFAVARLEGDPVAAPNQCADGTDNDGDGKTDFPADPGCSSAADNNETDPPVGPNPNPTTPASACPTGTSGGVSCVLSGGARVITGTGGSDTIVGTSGRDVIRCGGGDDVVRSGAGNDDIRCGAGNDTIDSGPGDDLVDGESGNDTVRGGPGADRLFGGSGDDRVAGGSGDDRISGGAGADVLSGNEGNDVISGGSENDRLSGNEGRDRLSGNSGRDRLSGGSSSDRLAGGSGGDRVSGGGGNDRVSGNSGNDRASGGGGNDRLSGGSGRDRLGGGSGNDRLSGNRGDDLLRGNSGRDRLVGGPGRDRLLGGPGRDTTTQ